LRPKLGKIQPMNDWAVITTGGKQYKVVEGDVIEVEKIGQGSGPISFDEVLLVKKDNDLVIGKPMVEKAKVKGQVLGNFKGKKIRVVKFKSKSRYLRTRGHRQEKTKVKIEKIDF